MTGGAGDHVILMIGGDGEDVVVIMWWVRLVSTWW